MKNNDTWHQVCMNCMCLEGNRQTSQSRAPRNDSMSPQRNQVIANQQQQLRRQQQQQQQQQQMYSDDAIKVRYAMLNCPHSEMKLKQDSFKTVLKLFSFSFISLWWQFSWQARHEATKDSKPKTKFCELYDINVSVNLYSASISSKPKCAQCVQRQMFWRTASVITDKSGRLFLSFRPGESHLKLDSVHFYLKILPLVRASLALESEKMARRIHRVQCHLKQRQGFGRVCWIDSAQLCG